MLGNLGSWIRLITRPGGVFWVTTPYAFVMGAFGAFAHDAHMWWGWSMPGQVLSLLLLFFAFLLFTIMSGATQVYRDGRVYLGGVSNALLDLSRQIVSFLDGDKEKEDMKRLLILCGTAIRMGLAGDSILSYKGFNEQERKALKALDVRGQVLTILSWISIRLSSLEKEGKLTPDQRLAMGPNLTAMSTSFGSCLRVQQAQLPSDFYVLGISSVFFFGITLPFVIVGEVGAGVVPVMVVVGYFLMGMIQLDFQTRDPYGNDANDLPKGPFLDGLIKGINAIFAAELFDLEELEP